MRVTLVTSLLRGGPVEHALSLGQALHSQGVRVTAVCASEDLAGRFEAAGARAAVLPLRHWLDAATARRVVRCAAGSDVVHAQDRRSGLWARLGPRPRPDGVRVYTLHGLPDPYLPPPVGVRRQRARDRIAYEGLDRALCWRSDAIVIPSRAMADLIVRRLGYPARRIAVIPHGVGEPGLARRTDGELVGTVSLLEPVKGLDVFLAAAAQVARRRPQTRFALYGSGSQAELLATRASELGIADRVRLPGHVPAEVALSQLSVFVISSWMENSPMGLLEAMAAGVPAVATRVGGVPEIATDTTAQVVAPGDVVAMAAAILRLLEDPHLRACQAAAARSSVLERFSPERSARATIGLYERLLSARRSRHPADLGELGL